MRFAALALACAALASAPAAEPPKPASFSFRLLNSSTPLQLSSYRGKVVLLVFISTTCPHCQDFTRELVPLSKEYAPKGVQILECAVDPGAQANLAGFIQEYQTPFPVGYSDQAAVDGFVGRSIIDARPFYVPHLVFLDRQGKVQADYAGESDFVKSPGANTRVQLDKLLAEKTTISKTGAKRTSAKSK